MTKGRVTEVHRTNFIVAVEGKELTATVRGNFHAEGDFPKVGDYVGLELLEDNKAVIEQVYERESVIKRKSSDSDEEQIIASNVDKIFIVMGLDGDFSINRLQRYLLLAEQCNIPARIILNKIDAVAEYSSYLKQVEEVSRKSPVIPVSALTGEGMEKLLDELEKDTTSVLLGSSGAGKSTITNWLLNENKQSVNEIREGDSKGRHTTTSRQLFVLPNGSFLIDTPGMRELGVIETDAEDENSVFEKIGELAKKCRFRNCDHEKSAGCAVLTAISTGDLSEAELNNYHKLLRERAFLESKDEDVATRHYAQNQKRKSQQHAAIQRQKLSRRLK